MTSFVFSFDYELLTSRVSISPFTNFTIINSGKKYLCNSLIASSFSNSIYNLLMSNCIANQIEIDAGEGPMEIVIDFLNGKDVEIPKENSLFILNAAVELGIDSLIQKIDSHYLNLTPKQSLDLALKAFNKGISIDIFTKTIAEGFEELIKMNAFENIPEVIIDMILKTRLVKLPPTQLISFLFKYFNFATNPTHRLAKYYPFTHISKDVATKLLNRENVNINRFFSLPTISQEERIDRHLVYIP